MLHTMTRSVLSPALLVLVVASLGPLALACSKDKKDEGDAAADSAVAVEIADAAADAADAADADAVDAADAATAPLATVVAPKAVPKADPPICASARSAKKRGSPAAAGLEAQCRAAGGTP